MYLAYQNASRAEKLRNEVAQEKRENLAFMQNAERSKMIQNIQRKKLGRDGGTDEGKEVKLRRQFTQKTVIEKGKQRDEPTRSTPNNVLCKVFE